MDVPARYDSKVSVFTTWPQLGQLIKDELQTGFCNVLEHVDADEKQCNEGAHFPVVDEVVVLLKPMAFFASRVDRYT